MDFTSGHIMYIMSEIVKMNMKKEIEIETEIMYLNAYYN